MWVAIDDNMPDHPKFLRAGPHAQLLFINALTYASRQLTDGFIPAEVVPRLVVWPDATDNASLAVRLVEVGLWEDADGGYQIHDYHDYQFSRDYVLAKRVDKSEKRRQAGIASGAARRAKAERVLNTDGTGAEQNRNTVGTNGEQNRTPSHPIPREEEEDARETPRDAIIAAWQQGTKESGKNAQSGCMVLDLLLERAEEGWSLDLLGELAREAAGRHFPRSIQGHIANLDHSNVRTLADYEAWRRKDLRKRDGPGNKGAPEPKYRHFEEDGDGPDG